VAYGPGGGADEATQSLAYTVTAVPAATLGAIFLADGTTSVTTNAAYTLAQLQGMQFKATADANGGPATFAWTVTDSGGTANGGVDTLIESLTISVTPVNDAPVRTGGAVNSLTVAEDAPATSLGLGGLQYGPGGGTDEATQSLTCTVTAVPTSTLGTIVLADGTTPVAANAAYTLAQLQGMQFKAAPNANGGPATFAWKITDNGGTAGGGADSLTESLTIGVTAVNDAPVRTAGTVSNLSVAEDTAVTSLGLGGLAYGPGGGADEAAQGLTYTVTAVPAATLGNIVLGDGTTVVVGNAVYTLSELQGMQFKAVPDANGGPATFSWKVTDNGGTANGGVDTLTESLAISVTAVNDAPVRMAGAVTNLSVAEDTPVTSLGLGGLAYGPGGGSDEATQSLTCTVTAMPTATLGTIVLADGTTSVIANTTYTLAQLQGMQFKAAANANGGPSTFAWTVTDGGGTANGGIDALAESLTISVTAVNDAPARAAGVVNNLSVTEDAPTTSLGLGGLAYGPGGGADEATQSLIYTVTAVPVAMLGTIVLADGTTAVTTSTAYTLAQLQGMQFKATADANGGPATFAWTVADDGGTSNGGVDALSESLTINVPPVNDAPVRIGGAVNGLTVAEDAPATSLGLGGVQYGPGGGSGELGQILACTVTAVPAATFGNVVLADGSTVVAANTGYTLGQLQGMQFKAAPNANGGPVTFAWKITDNGGTANGGIDTLTESLTISVTAVNDAPTTAPVTLPAIAEDSSLLITSAQLLANATDIDGGPLTVTGLAASSGTLVDNGNGTWTFTPAANDDTAVGFSYTIGDGAATVVGAASLDLTPVNDPPVANADTLAATEDTPVTYAAADLLGNDTDVEGSPLAIAGVTSGAGGTVVLNADGSVTFTPDADFNGAARFTYAVSDGTNVSGAATVNVDVRPVEDAPVIGGGPGTIALAVPEQGTAVTTVRAGDADLPAQALRFSIGGGADAGRFVIDPVTGVLSFAAAPDYEAPADAGADNIYDVVVRVSDGVLSSSQTFTVAVQDVADGPTILPPAPAPAPAPASAPAPTSAEPAAPAPASVAASNGSPPPATARAFDASIASATSVPAAAAPSPGRIAPSADGSGGADNALGLAVNAANSLAFATPPTLVADGGTSSHILRAAVFDHRGVELIALQTQDPTFNNFGVTVAPEGRQLEELQRTLRSGTFAEGLDRLRRAVRDELQLEQSVTISVAGVSLGLSLVYLLWLVRGGVLMGSYLSALPAWRILDPLPVLARPDEEADEDDDDLAGGNDDGPNALRGFG
jgi:hypothetical protein